MKQLYLIRHARAAESAGGGDSKRSLLKSGRSDAKAVAKKLKKLAEPPQLILTSSAKRAVQTAEIFAKTLAVKSKKIQKRAEIYDAGRDGILTLLRGLDSNLAAAMVIGHVPALNDLAQLLLKDFKGDIPTSGVVAIDLNIENWSELGEGVGSLLFSESPQQRAKKSSASKAIRQKLQAAITAAVAKELNKVDRNAAGKMATAVEKAGAKISQKFSKLIKKAQSEAAKSEKKKSAKKQATQKSE